MTDSQYLFLALYVTFETRAEHEFRLLFCLFDVLVCI